MPDSPGWRRGCRRSSRHAEAGSLARAGFSGHSARPRCRVVLSKGGLADASPNKVLPAIRFIPGDGGQRVAITKPFREQSI